MKEQYLMTFCFILFAFSVEEWKKSNHACNDNASRNSFVAMMPYFITNRAARLGQSRMTELRKITSTYKLSLLYSVMFVPALDQSKRVEKTPSTLNNSSATLVLI